MNYQKERHHNFYGLFLRLLQKFQSIRLDHPLCLLGFAIFLAILQGIISFSRNAHWLNNSFGDTDDATRIVMMRELLAGRGFWDQHWMRLQPPFGLYMHWSRLIDAGLAGLTWIFQLGLPASQAELATRIVWPVLCTIPAIFAMLIIIKTLMLGQAKTVNNLNYSAISMFLVTAILLLVNLGLYSQFRTGRVDHHNLQIAMTLLALAGVLRPSLHLFWGVMGGVATGLGLAIGLEALFFYILILGFVSQIFLRDPKAGPFVATYFFSLSVTILGLYFLQTAPENWFLPVCDALGINLALSLGVGGFVFVAAGFWSRHKGVVQRILTVAFAGFTMVVIYVGIDPHCLHGPFADVDPRLQTVWLRYVFEIMSWLRLIRIDLSFAIRIASFAVIGAGAFFVLLLQKLKEKKSFKWSFQNDRVVLLGLCFGLSVLLGALAVRMTAYMMWFSLPPLAICCVYFARHFLNGRYFLLMSAFFAFILSPNFLANEIETVIDRWPVVLKITSSILPIKTGPPPSVMKVKKEQGERCFTKTAFDPLAVRPKGLVLGEIDLGPFVLAYTPSSSLAAPYHRMAYGILTADKILRSKPDQAYKMIKNLHIDYVLECRSHKDYSNRKGLESEALQAQLDHGKPPSWLVPLTRRGAVMDIYRVQP